MKKVVRVAIIGQGRSGRDIHGVHLVKDERFKIVAVSDLLEDRRKRAAEEYGCETCEDYRALFQRRDLDLIVNATYSHLHVPITMEILKAGFNALCEKPLAKSVEEVDALMAAAEKSKKVFAIFQQSRFAPYYEKIAEIVRSGALGRIVQVSIAFNGFGRRWDWQTLQSCNGGNLLNTGPHPLDQALQFFGDGLPEVRCWMDRANTFGDAEDYVKLVLSGPGHPVVEVEVASCCAYPCFMFNVYGVRGGVKGDARHIDWKYFKPEEAPEQKLVREPLCKPDGTPSYCGEVLKWHTESWDVPKADDDLFSTISGRFYGMLYRTLTTGAPLVVTPEQVRRQIAVIEECQRQNPHIYKLKDRG